MLHRGLGRREARDARSSCSSDVRLAEPERAARSYPFALSGGERQRAMIAMAIGCGPRLLIADEPTTALDVTVQARILALIDGLRSESKMAVLLVSHDLAVIAGHCDRVIVMYAGVIMESGPVETVLREPRNPYTRALLEARPRPGAPRGERLKTIPGAAPAQPERPAGCPFAGRCALTIERCWTIPPPEVAFGPDHVSRCHRAGESLARATRDQAMSEPPLLEVSIAGQDLSPAAASVRLRARTPAPALDGVSFSISQGRSFGVVGESGSGKSTLARIALALDRPDSGVVRLEGRSLFDMPRRELRRLRAHMQMVFQDPYGSLDPRQRVETDRRRAAGRARPARAGRSAAPACAPRSRRSASRPPTPLKHPHEFSGGQRQRIAIARALITRPRLVVADEPVSALDVSVQAQALNLMSDLEREAGVTFLLISHDLAVVAHICATTAVMYRGRIVEIGSTAELFANPAHPYTRELVDATPRLDRPTRVEPPPALPDAPADGCPYAPRCPYAAAPCLERVPPLAPVRQGGRRGGLPLPAGLSARQRWVTRSFRRHALRPQARASCSR